MPQNTFSAPAPSSRSWKRAGVLLLMLAALCAGRCVSLYFLRWWLVSVVLGLAAAPLASLLFSRLPDRGYGFAKPLGLLLAGVSSWLFGHCHLPLSLWSGLSVVVVLSAWTFFKSPDFTAFLAARFSLIWKTELVFLLAFLVLAGLRLYMPEIQGGEKFMDMAFLNSLARAHTLPPPDPWMAGAFINYYYFGLFLMSLVLRATATPPAIAYNLALALAFALSVAAVFSLVYNLTQKISFSLFGVFLILLCGNPASGLRLLISKKSWAAYDWFAASRVIPNTINEFPCFSYLFGDLHAHLLAVPFAALGLAFALQHLRSGPDAFGAQAAATRLRAVFWGITLGALALINSWDLPTALVVAVLALGLQGVAAGTNFRTLAFWKMQLAPLALLLAAAVLPYLPFYLHFQAPIQGLRLTSQKTTLFRYACVFGIFLCPAISFVVLRAFNAFKMMRRDGFETHPYLIACLMVGAGLALALGFKAPVLGAAVGLGGLTVLWLWQARTLEPEAKFAGLLVVTACLLTAGCECFYIKDDLPNDWQRMNTVFKFHYQAWYLWGLAAVYGFHWIGVNFRFRSPWIKAWWVAGALVLSTGLTYPALAALVKADFFKTQPTLDGGVFLARSDPDEYAAIEWLRTHGENHAVVLEAVGHNYSDCGRVSAFSGLPTVLGWIEHEKQQRNYAPDIDQRKNDVDALYTATGLQPLQALLRRYHVDYVFVGSQERRLYAPAGLEKFAACLDCVYQNPGARIYRRRAVQKEPRSL